MRQQINITKNVTIELTPEQLQIVIGLLRKGTYEQVIGVLNAIEMQVVNQLAHIEATATTTETNGVQP